MTSDSDSPATAACEGSGQRPAEMVILDTTFGDPPGTCQVCGRSLRLRMYRLPEHDRELTDA